MKQTLYLVRHGRTIANTHQLVQDGTDPLSEIGKAQTKLIGKRFQTIELDVIISSPFVRAYETAKAIHRVTGAPLETNELFVEQRYASHQVGKSINDPVIAEERALMHGKRGDPHWHLADEENVHDLRDRAREALAFINTRTESNLAIVSHGMFIKMLVGVMWSHDITAEEFWRFRVIFESSNTGLTLCVRDTENHIHPDWRILTWNDHVHLADPCV